MTDEETFANVADVHTLSSKGFGLRYYSVRMNDHVKQALLNKVKKSQYLFPLSDGQICETSKYLVRELQSWRKIIFMTE